MKPFWFWLVQVRDIYGNGLTYKFVSQEFDDVGESLDNDLSIVTATLSRSILDESYKFEICIYGREVDDYDAPIVQNVYARVPNLFDEEMLQNAGAVDPNRVLSLFDQEMLRLLMKLKIKIRWNVGEESYGEIDPESHQNTGLLFVQDC